MCTITRLGAISADVAVSISAYTSVDTRPMHGRCTIDTRSIYMTCVGRYMYRPIRLVSHRHSTDKPPIYHRCTTDIPPMYYRHTADILPIYRPTIDRVSSNRNVGTYDKITPPFLCSFSKIHYSVRIWAKIKPSAHPKEYHINFFCTGKTHFFSNKPLKSQKNVSHVVA